MIQPLAWCMSGLSWIRREKTRLKLRRRGSFSQSTNLSLFLRPLLEKRVLQRLIGANLVASLAVVGGMSLSSPTHISETISNTQAPLEVLELKLSNTTMAEKGFTHGLPVSELTGISQYYRAGHMALDLRAPLGSSANAMEEGIVTQVSYLKTGYGHHVIVEHANTGLATLYAHLGQISVSVNDTVYAGKEIGKVGMTGFSTGPHLHFEVRRAGNSVDPLPLIKPALENWKNAQANATK